MKQTTLKVAGLALAAALAITARADVAIHQNVSLYGYTAGSIAYSQHGNGDNSDTKMDLDAAKLGLAFNFAPVTAKVSIYSDAGAKDLYLLEANATYDIGNGLSITGGRFQSWIGYEAFDIPNTNFITYGTDVIGAIIPNFHEGVRVDYNFDKMSVGLAVVDSVYNIDGDYRGDGNLSDGYGVEGHFGYNDGALSIGATLAYQNSRDVTGRAPVNYSMPLYKDTYIGDVWAQYIIKNTTIGAEFFYGQTRENSDANLQVIYGLVMVKQQLNEKFSIAGRFSIGQLKQKHVSDKPNFWKISAQPTYAVTQNLSVGVEVNYTKYNKAMESIGLAKDKSNFYAGVQACFKF